MSGNEAEKFQNNNKGESCNMSSGITCPITGAKICPQTILNKVISLLTSPAKTFQNIADNNVPLKESFLNYYMPLAVLSTICAFIGSVVFGMTIMGITVKASIVPAIISGIGTLALSLAAPFIAGSVINFFVDKFEGKPNFDNSAKLYLFALLPVLLAGITQIIPILSLVTIFVGLYCLYVYYCGVTPMTGVAEDKKLVFSVVSIVSSVIVMAVLGFIVSFALPNPYQNPSLSDIGTSVSDIMKQSGIEVSEQDMQKAGEMMESMKKLADQATANIAGGQ